jgi:hypothetical protein
VWTQTEDDGSTSNGPQDTWAASFALPGGWSVSQQLNSVSGATAWVYGEVAVGMDGAGHAVALWIQADASGTGPFQTWASLFVPASGWGAPAEISSPAAGGDAYAPAVALDGSGHAVAVWQQQNGTSAAIAASRLTLTSTSWSAPQLISTGGDAYDPHVAMDASGLAAVVWYQVETPGCTVRSAQATGAVWGAPTLVDDLAITYGLEYPVSRIAANAAGAPAIVWGVDNM